jgi:hypothetical protein
MIKSCGLYSTLNYGVGLIPPRNTLLAPVIAAVPTNDEAVVVDDYYPLLPSIMMIFLF